MAAHYDSAELPWHRLTDEEAERLVEACESFERAWENGAPPRIEDFIDGLTGEYRRCLLIELIRVDVGYLRQADEEPHLAAYQNRLPDDSRAIAEAFEGNLSLAEFINDLPLPETIDGYQITRELGRGGAGRVLLAQDVALDRPVAIKLLRTDKAQPALLGSLLSEAKQVAKLDHPYIAAVFGAGTYNEEVYVIYKFIEGKPLDTWVAESRPSYEHLAAVMVRIVDALAYIHSKGVVHRDIKPDNIIVADGDRPILIDFGLALSRLDAGYAPRGIICGTPGFLSPEQVQGKSSEVDGRSDIYSLGAMLYRLISGQPPFKYRTQGRSALLRLVQQILHDEPQPPRQLKADIPEELQRICLKAMATNRSLRYQCAADLSGSIDETICFWDLRMGRNVARLEGHTELIWDVAAAPKMRLAASAGWDQTVRVWNIDTRLEVARAEGHGDFVYGVRFSPDGQHLLSASADQTVRIWSLVSHS